MKAVIYNKESEKILGVILNVKTFTETDIFGDTEIHGLNPDTCAYLLLDDSVKVDFQRTDYKKKLEEQNAERFKKAGLKATA